MISVPDRDKLYDAGIIELLKTDEYAIVGAIREAFKSGNYDFLSSFDINELKNIFFAYCLVNCSLSDYFRLLFEKKN